ncbi:quinoprotein dehydrogenase-associated SoxYZ-like carrier [Paracoccus suum]|uniref:Quinoprotein dehydrogenase-associated SoxYZ-like carrier n=1 Tax=Paracoccus suum TaxID=2259340 RepID=A0A344PLR4_9RHOB|nr:quinoprotein dehydrogenase-associated SoxYZ-like carrier [Paracoccus suum]AXC50319.1 quinoprotein dehydrogenase-associated SoxYZ-like carrier [Paracoccus suum]
MRLALSLCLLLAQPAVADVQNPLQPSEAWPDIRDTLIADAPDPPIDPGQLLLDAPARADDPAVVPIHLTQPPGAAPIERLVLVIDNNPAPVAADFTFGTALMPLDMEVRVRVNAYSDVRAVAWLKDGRQVMAGRFVKASGGCAAPASKDPKAAAAEMGQMRLKAAPADDGRTMATLMIRHPMSSGLQRDQVTLLDIPAMFIDRMEVRQGDAPWLTMSAGISVAEDPVFRFAVTPGTGPVTVHAEDTDGHQFDQALTLN